jgi:8-oxo-dGTP pyrophosphatase MutT (NUDIX family)
LAKEKSCGALVYRWKEGRMQLLIIRHKLGGHWSFPKGHVEHGETERETAAREVREETGVNIQILDGYRRQVNYSPRPGVSKDVVYFLGYAADSRTVRQEEEVSELRWVDFDMAGEFLTYENDKNLLDTAEEYLGQNADTLPGIGASNNTEV